MAGAPAANLVLTICVRSSFSLNWKPQMSQQMLVNRNQPRIEQGAQVLRNHPDQVSRKPGDHHCPDHIQREMHTKIDTRPRDGEAHDQECDAQASRAPLANERQRQRKQKRGVVAGERRLGRMVQQLTPQTHLKRPGVIPEPGDHLCDAQSQKGRPGGIKQGKTGVACAPDPRRD